MFRKHLQLGFTPLLEATTVSPGAGGGAGTGTGTPSGGSPTSGTPSSASSPAGAQPATGPGGAGSPSNQGPVPWERFNEVNTKLGKLSWAEKYEDPSQIEAAHQLYQWFDQDPVGAHEYVTGMLKRNGHLKDQPATPSTPQRQPNYPTHEDGRPAPDIQIKETGQLFYSAEQAERLVDFKLSQLDSRIKPVEQFLTSNQAQTEARGQIAEAERTWPHFTDHAEDIFKELQRDRRLSLEGAYRRVVVPKLKTLERQAVIAEMQHTATASTTNPGAQTPATTTDLSKLSVRDLFKREMVKRGMGR